MGGDRAAEQREQQPVEAQTGTGTAEGEDQPLREGDVTREDALDDSVPEGDGLSD